MWADRDALVVSWATYAAGDDDPTRRQGGVYDRVGLRVWDLGAGDEPVPLDIDSRTVEASNGAGKVLTGARRRPVVDVRTRERGGPGGRRSSYGDVTALSPDGAVIAYPRGTKNPGPLVVQREGGTPRRLLEERVQRAVAWIDDDTVAFVTRDLRDPGSGAIETVSLSGEERDTLVDTGQFEPLPGLLATDLLAVAPRDFAEPSSPWDPRVVGGLTGFATLVALFWIWGWRRRAEP